MTSKNYMKFKFPCLSSFIETLPFTLVETHTFTHCLLCPFRYNAVSSFRRDSFHRLPTKPTVFIVYTFTENVC